MVGTFEQKAYFQLIQQLGTKLIFEQYYGKEVGLFGKDKRDKNPHTYTLGINYNPIPLGHIKYRASYWLT